MAIEVNPTADEVMCHLNAKLATTKRRRDVELSVLIGELIEMWEFFDQCKQVTIDITGQKHVSIENARAFHAALKNARNGQKHLKDIISFAQAETHRDKSNVIECLAASLFVVPKKTPKRIPTPYLMIHCAAYSLLLEADLKGVPWPTLSEIRREAERLLREKYKRGEWACLSDSQWRQGREYFALQNYFRSEEYGGGAKDGNRKKRKLVRKRKK